MGKNKSICWSTLLERKVLREHSRLVLSLCSMTKKNLCKTETLKTNLTFERVRGKKALRGRCHVGQGNN